MQLLLTVSLLSIFLLVKAQGDPFDFGSDWSQGEDLEMYDDDHHDRNNSQGYEEEDGEYRRPGPLGRNRSEEPQEDVEFRHRSQQNDSEGGLEPRRHNSRRHGSHYNEEEFCPHIPSECELQSTKVDLCMIDPQRNETMHFLSFGGVTANDGESWYCDETGTLKIDSSPFHSWVPPSDPEFLDHMKYIMVSNDHYDIPGIGQLSVEYKAKVHVKGIEEQPFPPEMLAESNDVRLGNACLSTVSLETGFIIGFLVTNDRIYAHYQRLTVAQEYVNQYAAFCMVIPLAERCKDDCNSLRVVFDGRIKQVSFLVDGVRKYWIDHLGFIQDRRLVVLDQGGEEELMWPKNIQLLFGSATLLDYYPVATNPACRNPYEADAVCGFSPVHIALVRTGDDALSLYDPYSYGTQPANYYDPMGEKECKHIWGQGCNIDIKSIKVDHLVCLPTEILDMKKNQNYFAL